MTALATVCERSPTAPMPVSVTWGRTTIDPASRRAFVDGNLLKLTGTEYRLLAVLVQAQGQDVATDTISQAVLGRPHRYDDGSVKTTIHLVRRAMPPSLDGSFLIQVVRAFGYFLRAS